MKHIKSNTKVYRDESRLFYCAFIFCVTIFFAYIYFVSASVADVVMRKEVDAKIQDMHTRISQLEATYIEKQHEVSDEIASYRGFVTVESKIFIDTQEEDTLVMRDQ